MNRAFPQTLARSFFNQSNRLIWLAVTAHLLIAVPLAGLLNIWLDEAWSLKTTANLTAVWNEAIYGERQAPFYFLLLGVWRIVDDSVFFARLFSIVCTTLAIFVFAKLARRILPAAIGKYAVLFFAVHPYLIFIALEVRVYALVVLLSALLIFFWHEGVANRGEANKRAAVCHAVVAVIGLYIYYYVGFLLVAGAVALLVLRRWQALKSYLLQMTIVAAAIVPLVFIIREQFAANSAYARPAPSVYEGVRIVWHHLLQFVLPAEGTAIAFARLWLVRITLLVLLFLLIKSKARILSRTTVIWAAYIAVCGTFFFAVYYLLGAQYLEIRHVAPLFIPASLFLASVLADVVPSRALVLIAALLCVFYGATLFSNYLPLAKRGDWARIAAFVEKHEQPDEPIVVFRAYDELPLGFYYRGANQIVLKGAAHDPFDAEDVPRRPTRWRNQIETIVREIPANHERLWLITEETCDDAETRIECEPLEDFVGRHYVVERTELFYKRKLRLLRRK